MNATLKAYLDDQAEELEEDVRHAIELAGGDVTHALRVTLIANSFLSEEVERLKSQVSTSRASAREQASNIFAEWAAESFAERRKEQSAPVAENCFVSVGCAGWRHSVDRTVLRLGIPCNQGI